jgi:hypothetical protein
LWLGIDEHITLPQGERHTPVWLGEAGDEALLGMVTPEEPGLVVSPLARRLQPMRMMLAWVKVSMARGCD